MGSGRQLLLLPLRGLQRGDLRAAAFAVPSALRRGCGARGGGREVCEQVNTDALPQSQSMDTWLNVGNVTSLPDMFPQSLCFAFFHLKRCSARRGCTPPGGPPGAG